MMQKETFKPAPMFLDVADVIFDKMSHIGVFAIVHIQRVFGSLRPL